MGDVAHRVGLFGGSFNPIHCGHIALAQLIRRQMALQEVWFLVSPLNPFKEHDPELQPDEVRLQMVEAALRDEPSLKASDYEFHLPKPSYTWDTLQSLFRDFPHTQFILIIGADNWLAFDRWYHHEDILRHCQVAVYPRLGCRIDPKSLPLGVSLIDAELFPYSSTLIRERLRSGQSVKGMVPDSILDMAKSVYAPHP